jgi:phage terminase large subunit-like protein
MAAAPSLQRVVVAIDPAVTSGENANETGIVVVGRDNGEHGYVWPTLRPVPAGRVGKIAIAACRTHHADRIVAEVNNGGDMVENTLRMVHPNAGYGRSGEPRESEESGA